MGFDSRNALLKAVNLRGYYRTPEGYVHAVDGCTLRLHEGDLVGIAGESACGKSTLGKLLIGYDKHPLKVLEGTVVVGDVDIYSMPWNERKALWGSSVAMIPQYSMNSLNPTRKIRNLILDAMKEKFQSNLSEAEFLKRAELRFKDLGLSSNVLEMYPFELSGGMKQRVVIAISTLLSPRVLVVDEPTSALDVSTQRLLLGLLNYIVRHKIVGSMAVISHDIASLRQICEQMYIMYAGKIVESVSTEDMIDRPLHPYTKLLLNAVITIDPEIRDHKLEGIPGAPPGLLKPPPGCRFYERCAYAMERCKVEEPPLLEVESNRLVACWLYG
ncbi:MAG: ABC transporter ATP-binding protein [Candidatus Bathyarchaeia archaeon]